MADNMQAVPRSPALGLFSDGVGALNDLAQQNSVTGALADGMSLEQIKNTLDRMSYGESMGTGRGWAWSPRPDTTDALLGAAGLLPYSRIGGALHTPVHSLDSILHNLYNKIGNNLK